VGEDVRNIKKILKLSIDNWNNETDFFALIMMPAFVSCKEENTVQPNTPNGDPLVGGTS